MQTCSENCEPIDPWRTLASILGQNPGFYKARARALAERYPSVSVFSHQGSASLVPDAQFCPDGPVVQTCSENCDPSDPWRTLASILGENPGFYKARPEP